jgi:hypothetical protein
MKNMILSALLVSFILLSATGCSNNADETTTAAASETTATTTTTEEETEEEAPLPYVELTSSELIAMNYYEYVLSDNEDTPVFTNVDEICLSCMYTENSDSSELNYKVEYNDELLYEGSAGLGGVLIDHTVSYPILNDAGYLPDGVYDITIFNRNEVIIESSAEVVYDPDSAVEHNSIVHYYEAGNVRHYTDSEFYDIIDSNDEYVAGGSGIYTQFNPGITYGDEGNYTVEWTCNGEAMDPVVFTDVDQFFAQLSFEMPDGSPMPAGTYEFNYYKNDGSLVATETLTLR